MQRDIIIYTVRSEIHKLTSHIKQSVQSAYESVPYDPVNKDCQSLQAERRIVIGFFSRFCLQLQQSSFQWIISNKVVSRNGENENALFFYHSIKLMTPLTTHHPATLQVYFFDYFAWLPRKMVRIGIIVSLSDAHFCILSRDCFNLSREYFSLWVIKMSLDRNASAVLERKCYFHASLVI